MALPINRILKMSQIKFSNQRSGRRARPELLDFWRKLSIIKPGECIIYPGEQNSLKSQMTAVNHYSGKIFRCRNHNGKTYVYIED